MSLLERVKRFADSPSLDLDQKIAVVAYNLAESRCESNDDKVGCIAHIFPDMQRDITRGMAIQVDDHAVATHRGRLVVSKIMRGAKDGF